MKMSYTATIYHDTDVFLYRVYWIDGLSFQDIWKFKDFATKKGAKMFAKSKKKKGFKPYPYITQMVTIAKLFREDVRKEPCNIDFKTTFERSCYRKILKY